jgi:uncharacterized membrane protein
MRSRRLLALMVPGGLTLASQHAEASKIIARSRRTMKRQLVLLMGGIAALSALANMPRSAYADIIYDVSLSGVSLEGMGESISGSVTISCTPTCTLDSGNVTAWQFVGTGTTPFSISSTDPSASIPSAGNSDLEANLSALDAIQNNPGGAGFVFKQTSPVLEELTFNDEGLSGVEVTGENSGDPTTSTSFFLLGSGGPTTSFTLIPIGVPVPVPEPASLILFGSGLAALAGLASRRRRSRQRSVVFDLRDLGR